MNAKRQIAPRLFFLQSVWFPLRFVYLSACRSVTRLVSSAGPAVLPRSKTKERQTAAQDEGDLALSVHISNQGDPLITCFVASGTRVDPVSDTPSRSTRSSPGIAPFAVWCEHFRSQPALIAPQPLVGPRTRLPPSRSTPDRLHIRHHPPWSLASTHRAELVSHL